MNWAFLLHQTLFGAIAAAGFGVLFNVGLRQLPWCAACGALTLAVRTGCQQLGLGLVGASFAAALAVSFATELRWERTQISRDVLAVSGCIPLVPGSLASRTILALFALTRGNVTDSSSILFDAVQGTLLFMFTIGAIGTGLVLPMLLFRRRQLT